MAAGELMRARKEVQAGWRKQNKGRWCAIRSSSSSSNNSSDLSSIEDQPQGGS